MATKSFPSKNQLRSSDNTGRSSSSSSHQHDQYRNLNLSANRDSSILASQYRSKSVLNDNVNRGRNSVQSSSDYSQRSSTISSFKSSSKPRNHFNLLGTSEAKKYDKEDMSSAASTTSSTLSLHIAAYESDGAIEYKENFVQKDTHANDEMMKSVKQCFVNLEMEGFEFPRQQKENDDEEKKPGVTEFKASQKILDAKPTARQESENDENKAPLSQASSKHEDADSVASADEGINFDEVDGFLDDYIGGEAYQLLISIKNDSNKDNVGLNCRIAQACYILANCSKEEEQRRAFLLEGYEHIRLAYQKAPTNHQVLHWAPILTGSLSENAAGNKERIKYGHEFKKYIDEAIAQLPGDFALYHMRGRFRFEVASLSMIERGFASVFFGAPPSATYEEALEDLMKAEEMESGAIDNMLFLGKTYKLLGNAKLARRWLTKTAKGSGIDFVDSEQIEEAKKLLAELPAPKQDEIEESDCDTAEEI